MASVDYKVVLVQNKSSPLQVKNQMNIKTYKRYHYLNTTAYKIVYHYHVLYTTLTFKHFKWTSFKIISIP